ncbi:MAG: phosphatidate cytidylyltransferase [Sulfobacillus acidophilus]|uniref:Phosphatidate cytidylyltransferase n=1 Tax=Sulfobacillus acidophilus TaxID=53633 RepID=A0A2T2WG21_9FIRM|nr:MAG: phosphatidate cytidylyltransferase [Sulfobacillus acidophilus]
MAVLWRFDAVVLAFIVVAGFIALVAHHRTTITRSLTLLGILAVLSLALWTWPLGLIGLAALLALVGLQEVAKAWGASALWVTVAGGLGLGLGAWHPAMFLALPFLAVVAASWLLPRRWVATQGFALVLAVLVGVGLAFWARLAVGGVLVLVLLLQMNDAFSYFGGHLFGRHHIVSTISPGKTLEGYVAGLVGVGAGVALGYGPLGLLTGVALSRVAVVGLYLVIAGDLGDLFFSKLKRHLGIKDFSSLLPGHGGILDRFDNVIIGAPGFYLLWHLLAMGGH